MGMGVGAGGRRVAVRKLLAGCVQSGSRSRSRAEYRRSACGVCGSGVCGRKDEGRRKKEEGQNGPNGRLETGTDQ